MAFSLTFQWWWIYLSGVKNSNLQDILKQKLLAYSLQIDEIKNGVAKVECYIIKEIKVTDYNHFDSDRIILSHDLFNLDVKWFNLDYLISTKSKIVI